MKSMVLCCASVLWILLLPDAMAGQATQAPTDLLKEAESLQRAGKLDQAIEDYRLLLKQYPDLAQVRSNLGAALAGAGRYQEAITEYERALKLTPLPQIRMNLALAYYKADELPLAVENLEKVHYEIPDDLRIVTLLADCHLRLNENKQVIELLEPLDHGDNLAITYMLGTALVRDGQVAKGQVIINKILKYGDSAEARLLMGTTKLMVNDARGALDDLQKAVEMNPHLPSAHAYYGRALRETSDPENAEKAFRAELDINRNDFESNLFLGVLLKEEQRYGEALPYLKHASEVRPGDLGALFQIASLHLATQDLNNAQRELDAILKAAPNFLEAHVSMATLYYRLRRKEDGDRENAIVKKLTAEKEARDRILSNGDSAEARFLLGTKYFESGNYPAAVKELAQAIELNPRLPQLQSYYGRALLNTGDSSGAAAAFRKELEGNPHEYASNLALGQILIVSKKYDEALPLVEASLLSRPESTEAALALGQCFSGTGKLQDARLRLEAVTRADPSSVDAHRELLSVYIRLHLESDAARERGMLSRLERESAAKEGGPQINGLAPDFELAEVGGNGRIRLGEFRGRSPVVLVFGSYSCPNFRSAAGSLNALFKQYGRQAPFFLVYIREAHSSDNWQSTRNVREEISVAPALSPQDREDHAVMCMRALHLQFPALADGMNESVERSYSAWPSRAFVIGRDGRVLYSTRLTEQDFSPEEMAKALRAAISARSAPPR